MSDMHAHFSHCLYLYSAGRTAEAKKAALQACVDYNRIIDECLKSNIPASAAQRCLQRALDVHDALQNNMKFLDTPTMLVHIGSKVGPYMFYPWIDPIRVASHESDRGSIFTDPDGFLPISQHEVEWKRVSSLCGDFRSMEQFPLCERELLDTLSQSSTNDCSVVASLLSIFEYRLRTGKSPVEFPSFDSSTGRITLKMFFNGCSRAVVIDDYLPFSQKGPLFVHSTRTQSQTEKKDLTYYWPALLEKAYVKTVGDYDFTGSYSALDTHAFTGWIPEYILFREYFESSGTGPDELWDKISAGWNSESLLICLGTGTLPKHDLDGLTLIGDHDYAVVDLKETMDGDSARVRSLKVRNPWNHSSPTAHWVDFRTVRSRFQSMYLNWKPDEFQSSSVHFIFPVDALGRDAGSFASNPQFTIQNKQHTAIKVRLLLMRHLCSQIRSENAPLISLRIYSSAFRVIVPDESKAVLATPSRNTLFQTVEVTVLPKSAITVIASCAYDAPDFKSNKGVTFSFVAFSPGNDQISLAKAVDALPSKVEVKGEWTKAESGGSWALATYSRNPQYQVTVPSTIGSVPVSFYLISDSDEPINLQVMWSKGHYVSRYREQEVHASSGRYRIGACSVDTELASGKYTVIVSTYDADTIGAFRLICQSNAGLTLTKLIPETSSMFSRAITIPWNHSTAKYVACTVPRRSKLVVEATFEPESSSSSYKPHMVLSIVDDFSGSKVVASTGAFSSSFPLMLEAHLHGDRRYRLIAERMEAGDGSVRIDTHSEVVMRFL